MPALPDPTSASPKFENLLEAALKKANAARRAAQAAAEALAEAKSEPVMDEFARRLAGVLGGARAESPEDEGLAQAAWIDPEGLWDAERDSPYASGVEDSSVPRAADDDVAASAGAGEAGEPTVAAGPQGTGDYIVRQGDCMASIALAHGFFWETLWESPGNRELRQFRDDPHALLPGDRVFIPQKRRKEEPGQTEMRHRFVRRGEPSMLRITFLNADDSPRAGQPYHLEIDRECWRGELDENGTLEVRISGGARVGFARVGRTPFEDHYPLQLGALDPANEPSGIRARLHHLGYAEALTADEGRISRAALIAFQESHGLPPTARPDEQTVRQLDEDHQSR